MIIEWNTHIFSADTGRYPFHPRAVYVPAPERRSADPLADYLARMETLGLSRLSDWQSYSLGRQDIRAVAPGVTFYLTCRDEFGRDKARELFSSLGKRTLQDSIKLNLRRISEAVEYIWLKRLQSFGSLEEVTVTNEEDAPRLEEASFDPLLASPGTELQLRMLIQDGGRNLSPGGVFVLDNGSGRVLQPEVVTLEGTRHLQVQLPIDPERTAGEYGIEVTAVDDVGNVRIWDRTYQVK